jgi:hypothetical protein
MSDDIYREKWDRLQRTIQDGILTGYPNPERRGCPGSEAMIGLATRSARFDDSIEDDPQWKHVTHCSPCYAQYLELFQNMGLRKPAAAADSSA